MIPTTDTVDFSRLHDEPSRQLRVFPARGHGSSAFTLYEDDGVGLGYRRGEFAEVAFELTSTPRSITLAARKRGGYALPYADVQVVLPRAERRTLRLVGNGVRLAKATA